MNRGAQLLREKLAKHGEKKRFADRLGVDQTMLSHWLKGGSRKPPASVRAQIEDATGVGWRTWDEDAEVEPVQGTGGEAA